MIGVDKEVAAVSPKAREPFLTPLVFIHLNYLGAWKSV